MLFQRGNEDELSFQQRSLFQQFNAAELKQLEWGLRFTPTVCSMITLYALVVGSSALLFVVAALGVWAFFFPAGHPMDVFYNTLIRPMFRAVKLPKNPFQRRLACFSAGIMNTVAAILLLNNLQIWAWIVGGSLLVLQAVVICTHFCTLSWMYEGVMRLLGKWHKPIELEEAKILLSHGALIIDVRSQNEFAAKAVTDSINCPLEEIEQHLKLFKDSTCLLYCSSGTRSQIASQKLLQLGVDKIYDLGSFSRAQKLFN